MKIAVMQPYFFPYAGYFSLIQAVDAFVFYTDVQFVRRSWMSRNRILSRQSKDGWEYIHLPVQKAERDALLNQIHIFEPDQWSARLFGQLASNYSKAPHYKVVVDLLRSMCDTSLQTLAEFTMKSIRHLCQTLNIRTAIYDSRDLTFDRTLAREDRLIDLSKQFGADTYVNAIGGLDLYDKAHWQAQGVQLAFLKPALAPYPQGRDAFIPGLSIIDMLMWASIPTTSTRLSQEYTFL